MRKVQATQLCPLHKCLPSYSCTVYNIQHDQLDHFFFCEKCKLASKYVPPTDKNAIDKIVDSFGYGFTSQGSPSAALHNWNNAISRLNRSLLKKAVAGEDIPEILFSTKDEAKKTDGVHCFNIEFVKDSKDPTQFVRYNSNAYCQVVSDNLLACWKEIRKAYPNALILEITEDEDYEPED